MDIVLSPGLVIDSDLRRTYWFAMCNLRLESFPDF
jgi:hypothetical protein